MKSRWPHFRRTPTTPISAAFAYLWLLLQNERSQILTHMHAPSKVTGISIVIPNYNGRNLFEACLPTVVDAVSGSGYPWEIIVSDDCSTDDSLAYLAQHYPMIKTIANPVNRGFSPTINAGIRQAKLSHVLLLNSDVKLTPGYFDAQVPYFDVPDTFGVMSRIVGWDDEEIQEAGKYPVFHGTKLKTAYNYVPSAYTPGMNYPSFFVCGANAFVDREKLVKMGGFDELFAPFYIEDVELTLRAWRLGWKSYYEHSSVCRHKMSSSVKSYFDRRKVGIIYNRNKMYMHAIHLQSWMKVLWFVQLNLEALLRLITFQFSWLKSYRRFMGTYSGVGKSRAKMEKAAEGVPLLPVNQIVHYIQSALRDKITRI